MFYCSPFIQFQVCMMIEAISFPPAPPQRNFKKPTTKRRWNTICADFGLRKSMRYARLFADDNGESHFDDIEIEFTATDYVQSAAPLDFSATFPASQSHLCARRRAGRVTFTFRLRATCSLCSAVSGK